MKEKITSFVTYGYFLLIVLYIFQDWFLSDKQTIFIQNNFAELFIPISLVTLYWYVFDFKHIFFQTALIKRLISWGNLLTIILMSAYLYIIFEYFAIDMV